MKNKPRSQGQGDSETLARLDEIAHDLNNLLTIIRGRAQLALDERNPAPTSESLQQIMLATDRALVLVREVGTISPAKSST